MYMCHPPPRYEVHRHPIIRFTVHGLCSSSGRARSDFQVELVTTVDGLVTLVKSVYGVLNKHHKLNESYRNLHWRLHFQGDVFTLAEPEIHHFHLLPQPIRDGQMGWFEGSNASFRFSVDTVYAGDICPSKLIEFPKISLLPSPPSSPKSTLSSDLRVEPKLKEGWLSEDMKSKSKDFRQRFKIFMSGANVWTKDVNGDYFRDRPKPPKWEANETAILSLLISSGCKFQESWLKILQYCFVTRSEVGTSQQWYKVRKRQKVALDASSSASEPSNKEDMMNEVERLCLAHLHQLLEVDVPELGEHPLKRKLPAVLSEKVYGNGSIDNSQYHEDHSETNLIKRRRI